jgi:hypothetical protein
MAKTIKDYLSTGEIAAISGKKFVNRYGQIYELSFMAVQKYDNGVMDRFYLQPKVLQQVESDREATPREVKRFNQEKEKESSRGKGNLPSKPSKAAEGLLRTLFG